jgi:hypothetical protein
VIAGARTRMRYTPGRTGEIDLDSATRPRSSWACKTTACGPVGRSPNSTWTSTTASSKTMRTGTRTVAASSGAHSTVNHAFPVPRRVTLSCANNRMSPTDRPSAIVSSFWTPSNVTHFSLGRAAGRRNTLKPSAGNP